MIARNGNLEGGGINLSIAVSNYRTCPKCRLQIESSTAFFCYFCGEELPDEPVCIVNKKPSLPLVSAKKKKAQYTAKIKSLAKYFLVGIAVLSLGGAVVASLQFLKTRSRYLDYLQKRLPKWETSVLEGVNLGVPNFHYKENPFSPLAPQTVDWYLESTNPSVILSKILPPDKSKAIEEELSLTFKEIETYLSPRYALIRQATSSAFIAEMISIPFVQQVAAAAGEVEGFRGYILDKYLIVTNSESLLLAIEDCFNKLELSLALTPQFSEAVRKLPDSGQVFVYGQRPEWLIPESVSGTAWLVYDEDGITYVVGSE